MRNHVAKALWTAKFSAKVVKSKKQYTRKIKRWQSATASTSYEPKPGQTFSLSYRFTRNSINTVDFAFQTPIAANWYAVGRYNYSLQKRLKSLSD